jgi:hypothetical protein
VTGKKSRWKTMVYLSRVHVQEMQYNRHLLCSHLKNLVGVLYICIKNAAHVFFPHFPWMYNLVDQLSSTEENCYWLESTRCADESSLCDSSTSNITQSCRLSSATCPTVPYPSFYETCHSRGLQAFNTSSICSVVLEKFECQIFFAPRK